MKGRILFLLMLLSGQALIGQDERADVFAPFVSRLKTRASEAGVVLTWQNSADLRSAARVYRHTEEITAENLDGAELIARLEPGEQSFADYPPTEGTYWYAVLLEDETGEPYLLFIPFRNKTVSGIAIRTTVSEEELAARVADISAAVDADTVLLRFSVSRADRELLLFRSTGAIRASEDLLAASTPLPLAPGSTRFVDSPIPGVDYFYAVVDSGLFRLGKAQVLPGVNATVQPVSLAAEAGRTGLPVSRARPTPLPSLLIASGVERGQELEASSRTLVPDRRSDLQPETARAVAALLRDAPPPPLPALEVEILQADTVSRSRGEEYTLKEILDGHLARADYAGAEDLLNRYLSIRRPPEIESRAHFYLGQAHYFQQEVREAFLEFLLSEDLEYREAQPWLDACLRRMYASAGR